MENKQPRIWFVTGISSGIGQALTEAVMQSGDFLIGTFRTEEQVVAFNEKNAQNANSAIDGNAFALRMDVTDSNDIKQAFTEITQKFGRLDVLVNNAGFGMAGAIEETSLTETRELFEANFFGALQVTQTALPLMRSQRSGHIIQISSHGGFKAMPGFGIYNASKFALEGFSEALAAEIAPLGIKLTIVEPGPFRTKFAGNGFRLAARTIEEYSGTAGVFRQRIKGVDGKQEGDPQKAAEAIIDIVHAENPPLRLPLGKTAIATITSKLESVQRDLDAYREVAQEAVYA